MRNKIILGLVGEIASGKDTVAQFLEEEFKSATASFSQPLRQILDILSLPQSRENMVWLGVDLRQRFGQDILAKAVSGLVIKSQSEIVCLPNIRLEGDVILLKTLPDFYLIRIETDQRTRYDRLIKRDQNTDDAGKTWAEFLADSQLPTEVTIKEIGKQAQFVIDNNTCKANLCKQVRRIIESIRG